MEPVDKDGVKVEKKYVREEVKGEEGVKVDELFGEKKEEEEPEEKK